LRTFLSMESLSGELVVSANLPIEFWCFLAVAVLCSLFVVVTYWLVHTNRNSAKRVVRMIEDEKQTRAREKEEERAELKLMKADLEKDFINLRFTMLQDFRRSVDDIRKIDVEAREYLKSLGNELMSQMEQREYPKEQSQTQKQPQIDGKKSLRKGLEIQKEFTSEYELTHRNTRHSLKKGEPDIVEIDSNGKISEVVAVKSFDLEITEKGKTCRNVKGHKFAVSFLASRDAKAEVETAIQNGLSKIRLVVFNLKTKHKIFDDFVSFNKKIKIREKKP
jgi:hypothetical protein